MEKRSMAVIIGVLLGLISVVGAVPGIAVLYNNYSRYAFYQYQDKGVMTVGVSDRLWDKGRACGSTYSVRCTGANNAAPHPCKGNNPVTVVDYCRAPCNGLIDPSRDAFRAIANLDAGNIKIDYTGLNGDQDRIRKATIMHNNAVESASS